MGALFMSTPRGGPKLTDLNVTGSTYGQPIPVGFGSCRIPGNVIYSDPLHQHSHPGGKGGLLGPTTYTYSWTGAVALCSTEYTGPIKDVVRIWADTKLVYDKTGASLGTGVPGDGGGKGGGGNHYYGNAFNRLGNFTLYTGTQDQMPDAALEAAQGVLNCNANRGMAYVVFEDVDLENYGNRVPNWTFEVVFNALAPNTLGVQFAFDTTTVAAPEADSSAIDTQRHWAYFIAPGDSSNSGIHVIDLDTGDWLKSVSFGELGGATSGGLFNRLEDAMQVGTDGYLYVYVGYDGAPANCGAILKIDPDALVAVTISDPVQFTSGMIPCNPGFNGMILSSLGGIAGNYITILNLDLMQITPRASPATNPDPDHTAGVFPLTYAFSEISGGVNVTDGIAQVIVLDVPENDFTSFDLHVMQVGITGITDEADIVLTPAQFDSTWTQFDGAGWLIYDSTDGNAVFGVHSTDTPANGHSASLLAKVNTSDGSVMWTSRVNSLPQFDDTGGQMSSAIDNGEVSWIGNAQASYVGAGDAPPSGDVLVYTVATQDGNVSSEAWAGLTAGYQASADTLGAVMFFGRFPSKSSNDAWNVIFPDSAVGAAQPLDEVVTTICEMTSLTADDIDVTLLADKLVEGYVITNQISGKDAITPLGLAFQFDSVESDAILKFIPRGAAPSITIPNTDMVVMNDTTNATIDETRKQEVDIPNQININFLDPNHDFQQATQYFRRPSNPYPVMFSNNPRTENLNIVAQPTFMKQLCESLLYQEWIERVSYRAKLSWTWLTVDPTDVVTVTLSDDSTNSARTDSISLGADLSSECTFYAQSAAVYSSDIALAFGGAGFPQQNLIPPSGQKFFFLDTPLLRDIDDPGFSYDVVYIGAGSYKSNWPGVEIYQSKTNSNFQDLTGLSKSADWGVASTVLGDTDQPFRTDKTNALTVSMVQGGDDLASCTYLEMMNGQNTAALYNSTTGVVELIQFQTVTVNSDGTYTLSNLLRGCRGTDAFTGNHAVGEYLVMLSSTALSTFDMALSDVGAQEFYKAVQFGSGLDITLTQKFTNKGRALAPYAPVHLVAATSGSDIALSWDRRTRVNGALKDGTGTVPLMEQDEAYSVDIYDSMGENVLRTLNVDYKSTVPTATPGVTYTDAEFTADFGSKPKSINMIVYQVGTLGRGFGKMYNVVVDNILPTA